MAQKTVVIRSEGSKDSKLEIKIDEREKFKHFVKWLDEYIKFSEVAKLQYTLCNANDMKKCRLKALRMGFVVVMN